MYSGGKKNIDKYTSDLFSDKNYRNAFSKILKSKLNIDEANYRNLYKNLSHKQDLQEIKTNTVGDAIKETLKEFLNKNSYKLNGYKYNHNELITYAAKPIGIFAKDNEDEKDKENYNVGNLKKKLDDMPEGLKYFAEKYNVPILNVTKENKKNTDGLNVTA